MTDRRIVTYDDHNRRAYAVDLGSTANDVARRVKERKCFVPASIVTTLQVTFRATPKV